MTISTLLRFLLRQVQFGIVETGGGGGGAAADDDEPQDEGGEADEAGEEGDDDKAEGAQGDDAAGAAATAEGEGEGDEAAEIVVSLGEEPAAEEDDARAPQWIRELRKSNREKERRIRELEAKVAAAAPAPQAVVVGAKPTLEGCDFDAEKFERDLEAWHDRKRQADDQQRTREQSEQQQRAQWQTRIDAVHKAVSTLKVNDYDEAAEAFEDLFPSLVHRGIVMGGPDDPKTSALLRYALGKNPKKAQELAAITDPVKFAFAVAKLEVQLKVAPRKAAPPPDTVVRSSVAGSAAIDSTLERLRAEADKTGNRSKVAAYIRQKSQKQAA